MKNKPKILAIVGPTASGKSDLAVKLALELNGEIVSSDSRQVYKGLNVGTGKITEKEKRGVSHHLLDIVNPKHRFTVDKYKKLADKIIGNILSRNKLPILCGGSGFYVDAVINNADFPPVEANAKLRNKLAGKSPRKLLDMLEKLDSDRVKDMNESDQKNPRRLIRALEIAIYRKKHGFEAKHLNSKTKPWKELIVGLVLRDDNLKEHIQARVMNRIRKGMIREARDLHSNGLSFKRMREIGLEYGCLADFLERKISREQLIESIMTRDWQYARRQKTWWRRDKRIKWFDPDKFENIRSTVKKFLSAEIKNSRPVLRSELEKITCQCQFDDTTPTIHSLPSRWPQ